jgi:hypothetical protein
MPAVAGTQYSMLATGIRERLRHPPCARRSASYACIHSGRARTRRPRRAADPARNLSRRAITVGNRAADLVSEVVKSVRVMGG